MKNFLAKIDNKLNSRPYGYLHIMPCDSPVICSKDENNSVRIAVTGCKNLSAFKIVAVEETLFFAEKGWVAQVEFVTL